MPSPNDNFQLRDGVDALFKVRAKDTSAASDGSLQSIRHLATPYPVDYGVGGCYSTSISSGSMAAGLAAGATIFGFRWSSTTLIAIIREMRLSMWSIGTGFTAGIATFALHRAAGWSASDSGGAAVDLASPSSKLRAAMAASSAEMRIATTAALTAGTRTLHTNPCGSVVLGLSNATNTVFSAKTKLIEVDPAKHPHAIAAASGATSEGLVLRATVPATGVWGFNLEIDWDEVPLVNY